MDKKFCALPKSKDEEVSWGIGIKKPPQRCWAVELEGGSNSPEKWQYVIMRDISKKPISIPDSLGFSAI